MNICICVLLPWYQSVSGVQSKCHYISASSGYGNIFPVTSLGRWLTIVYAVIGIPIFMIVVADLGIFFTKVSVAISLAWIHKWLKGPSDCLGGSVMDLLPSRDLTSLFKDILPASTSCLHVRKVCLCLREWCFSYRFCRPFTRRVAAARRNLSTVTYSSSRPTNRHQNTMR